MPAHGPAWSGSSSFDRLALLTTQREAVGPEAKKDFVDPHTRWVGTWSPKKSVGVADRSGGDPIVRRRFARVRKAGRKAAREKREVSARATDWTHDPGTTVSGQRIFQRPAAAASPPPRMLAALEPVVPALALKDQLRLIAAEMGMPLTLVAATTASLQTRGAAGDPEAQAAFQGVLDQHDRLVGELADLPAGTPQTATDGPAQLSPATLQSQLKMQKFMETSTAKVADEAAAAAPDHWGPQLAQRHEERAQVEAHAHARWEMTAGPGTPHRRKVDRFKRNKLGLQGRMHGWEKEFKAEAEWIAARRMMESATGGDPEQRWARIDDENQARLPDWYHSPEQKSVRELSRLEQEQHDELASVHVEYLHTRGKLKHLTMAEMALLQGRGSARNLEQMQSSGRLERLSSAEVAQLGAGGLEHLTSAKFAAIQMAASATEAHEDEVGPGTTAAEAAAMDALHLNKHHMALDLAQPSAPAGAAPLPTFLAHRAEAAPAPATEPEPEAEPEPEPEEEEWIDPQNLPPVDPFGGTMDAEPEPEEEEWIDPQNLPPVDPFGGSTMDAAISEARAAKDAAPTPNEEDGGASKAITKPKRKKGRLRRIQTEDDEQQQSEPSTSTQIVASGPAGAGVPAPPRISTAREGQLRAIFARVDRNSDGRLSRAELILRLRKDGELASLLGLPQQVGDEQRAAFEAVFQSMDSDSDKEVDADEFVAFFAQQEVQGEDPEARARELVSPTAQAFLGQLLEAGVEAWSQEEKEQARVPVRSVARGFVNGLLQAGVSGAADRLKPSAASHPEQWAIFTAMDADGNGTLDFDELFFALADSIEEGVAYELLEVMDTSGDGVIDFAEFCDGWEAFTSASGGGGSAHLTKADAVAVGHFVHEAKVMYKQADEVEDEDLPKEKTPQAEAREAELKKLHDAGLIDDENFEAEMAAIS